MIPGSSLRHSSRRQVPPPPSTPFSSAPPPRRRRGGDGEDDGGGGGGIWLKRFFNFLRWGIILYTFFAAVYAPIKSYTTTVQHQTQFYYVLSNNTPWQDDSQDPDTAIPAPKMPAFFVGTKNTLTINFAGYHMHYANAYTQGRAPSLGPMVGARAPPPPTAINGLFPINYATATWLLPVELPVKSDDSGPSPDQQRATNLLRVLKRYNQLMAMDHTAPKQQFIDAAWYVMIKEYRGSLGKSKTDMIADLEKDNGLLLEYLETNPTR